MHDIRFVEMDLKQAYHMLLPRSCSAFARGTILEIEDAVRVFVEPHIHQVEYNHGSPVNKGKLKNITDIYSMLGRLEPGSRVVVSAPAGYGKSTLLGHLASDWRDGHPSMCKYKHLFLLVLRQLHNHTVPIETIICKDAALLDSSLAGQVRRSLKFNSQSSILFIDGYDELPDMERPHSTISQVISGELAKQSVVIVTARPHCLKEITDLIKGYHVRITLGDLTPRDVRMYCEEFFKNQNDLEKGMTNSILNSSVIPYELLQVPIFLALTCVLFKMRQHGQDASSDNEHLRTRSSVLATFWGMLMGLKEEKDKRSSQVVFYNSLMDRSMHPDTKRLLKEVSKLCFHFIQKKIIDFVPPLTEQYDLDLEDVGKLGPTRINGTNVEFLHSLFQEYCAGIYISSNMSILKQVLTKLDSLEPNIEKLLTPYANALVFAVSINPDMLRVFAQHIYIPMITYETDAFPNMELSFITRLAHECTGSVAKKHFAECICQATVAGVSWSSFESPPDVNPNAYISFMQDLGQRGCMLLLKHVYGEHITLQDNRATLTLPKGDTLVVTDPFLLACLPAINLHNAWYLEIHCCSLVPLRSTKKWLVILLFSILFYMFGIVCFMIIRHI